MKPSTTDDQEEGLPVLSLEAINTLAPSHTTLRFKKSLLCSDEKPVCGFNIQIPSKEWRCKRCCLLQMLQGPWKDIPDNVGLELRILVGGDIANTQ